MGLTLLTFWLLSGVDTLVPFRVSGLSFKAPKAWKHVAPSEGNGGAMEQSFMAPHDDADFQLTVFDVVPEVTGQTCVDALAPKLNGTGWKPTEVGSAPALRQVSFDVLVDEQGKKATVERTRKVSTVTYVGCNGKKKWIMTFTAKESKAARFGVILRRIVQSIKYEN